MTHDLLTAGGGFEFQPSPLASLPALTLVHDPAYVEAFLNGTLDPRVIRRIGFPWSEALVLRTLASVGGTLAATEHALRTGWCGTLAGGTHHAFRHEGAGFCVFNDIAVAINWLRANGHIRRAAVVDLDVHQGDGTARIFAGDPAVFTLSLHGRGNFPFRKEHSTLDVELDDGTTDQPYLEHLAAALPHVRAFAPEVLFYQAGADPLAEDRLGRLSLTPAGLLARDRQVFELARQLGCPLVITQGGGYAEPIALTAEAHAATFRLARDLLTGAAIPTAHSHPGL